MENTEHQLLKIDDEFMSVAKVALVRLAYLYPNAALEIRGEYVVGSCPADNVSTLRKEIAYAFYRERIASQNARLRETLLSRISSAT